MTFSVNCLILGDNPDRTLTVNISDDNENIYFLKELLKEKMAPRLNHVDASDLDLWKVDFSFEDHDLERLANFVPDGRPLYPIKKLQMFKDGPEKHIHVIVKVPGWPELLSLNCFILGHKSIFPVEIPRTKTVSILKDLIKEERAETLKHVAASDLKLWKVDIAFGNLFAVNDLSWTINPPTEAKLGNATLLSEVFQPGLDVKSVHVVVQVPAESRHIAGGEQEGRRDKFAALNQRFENTCKDIAKASAPKRYFPSITTYPGKDRHQLIQFKYLGYLYKESCMMVARSRSTEVHNVQVVVPNPH